jgi:fatty-acyl-CoA synthase
MGATTTSRQLLVGDIFQHAATAVPERTAAALGADMLTFADVQAGADEVATALRGFGVRRGDRVAVWCATSLDLVPLFAACAQIGAVFMPFNPALAPGEVAAMLAVARPSLLVVDAGRADPATTLAAAVPLATLEAVRHPHRSRPDSQPEVGGGRLLADAGVVDEVHEDDPHEDDPHEDDPHEDDPHEDDPHVVFFTSGSTGVPKGVVLSHRVNVLRSHPGAQFEPRGVAVCAFPLFHMAAWTIALQQWHARDAVVFVASASAEAIGTAVHDHRAARLNAVPLVWRRLLDHAAADGAVGSLLGSLRFADTGTSATPPELLADMGKAMPDAWVRVFYGSTEAGNVATLEHHDVPRKPGRVGVPSVHTELRIDDGGELLVRGPLLFDGYFDDGPATADAFVDGWYRTGDLAERDAEGYVSIVGRARDVIRSGGETVAPVEVEAVLSTMPSVADVAVIGLPDADWGEVVGAVVVAAAGAAVPTIEDVRAHCADRLAAFKHPRRLVVLDAIPRTPATGQVQRRLLVERVVLADG